MSAFTKVWVYCFDSYRDCICVWSVTGSVGIPGFYSRAWLRLVFTWLKVSTITGTWTEVFLPFTSKSGLESGSRSCSAKPPGTRLLSSHCSDVSRMWPLPSGSMTAPRVLDLPRPIKRSRLRAQPLPLKHPSKKHQVLQLVCNWLELSHMAPPCSCKGGWECSPSAEHIAAQNRSRGLFPRVGMGIAQAGNSLHHSEQPVYLHRPGEKDDPEPLEWQIDFILKSSPSDCSRLCAVLFWTQSP